MAEFTGTAMDAFFEEIKSIGFFGRLFSWGRVRKLSYEASNEYALLRNQREGFLQQINSITQLLESEKRDAEFNAREAERLRGELAAAQASLIEVRDWLKDREARVSVLESSAESSSHAIAELKAQASNLQRLLDDKTAEITDLERRLAEATTSKDKNAERIKQLEGELEGCRRRVDELGALIGERDQEIARFKSAEQSRLDEHARKMSEAQSFMARLNDDKLRLEQEREAALKAHMEDMKKTWLNHERKVEEALKMLCRKHTIEYLGKEAVPFRGKPDNTLRICEEYVIFDAKSPQGEDLSNFADYVKAQSKDVQKYAKEKDVRKDIFLVVPTNTIDRFDAYTINHGDYRVFIVTVDSLEPILLSLKRIEEYEFVDQLSPEEREDICRVIGRLSHLTKRRIQVDSFFCEEAFKTLKECGCLPEEFSERTLEYEKSTLLNPPVERKGKALADKTLEKAVETVKKETAFLDIDTSGTAEVLLALPLTKETKGGD